MGWGAVSSSKVLCLSQALCNSVSLILSSDCDAWRAATDYVFHLERTETGRWRFIDVSEAQERAMGEQASEEVLQQYRHAILPDSDRRVQQVKRVAFRLIRSAGLDAPDSQGLDVLHKYGTQTHPKSTVNWRVFVIRAPDESPSLSGFCLVAGPRSVF